MAKFYGEIGFAVVEETRPGIWEPSISRHFYYGDILDNTYRYNASSQANENVNISNQISIIADPFANQNLQNMRYVKFMGTKWKIETVKVQYPRLILTIGGEYNGEDES